MRSNGISYLLQRFFQLFLQTDMFLVPKSIVPNISAKNTCPPVNTDSSQEFDPKARAAGQFLPKIIRRKIAPAMEPSI